MAEEATRETTRFRILVLKALVIIIGKIYDVPGYGKPPDLIISDLVAERHRLERQ